MLTKFLPFLSWFQDYDTKSFKIDFLSGLTVALVLIPQSMAYAQLAGMPAYYGLYAAFLPPMIAALFGSSRQLATGPVAVVSLMTAATLEPLATAGSEGYIAYALILALMVGIFQLSLGILKLGLIVNFLSHPVVNGFTNAAAIIIASSQLSKLFGVYVDKSAHHYETIINVCKSAIHYTHWPTLFMGILAFAIMYGLKKFFPKIPNVLVAVVITTVISWAIGFQHNSFVNISTIHSTPLHIDINKFNLSINEIQPLTDERTKIGLLLEKAKKENDIIKVLNFEHNLNVLSIKINMVKKKIHKYRESIRYVLFSGIKNPDDSLIFYPKNEEPSGLQNDGRTWRIKVGNDILNPEKLLMMGGGAVVGTVPQGLPSISMPAINMKDILYLLPFTAIISLLGFMEAISIAKAMAAKTGQRLDPNQELIGQGLANILGAMGKSYPVSGSFSRSAVNLQAGAVSGLSSVFTSITVVIVLLFLTPLLYNLPQAVLAAVIMMAVIGLVNISGFIHSWKAQWYDGAISIISFLVTIAFAPHLDKGIVVGVILSLMVFLYKNMRPTVSYLSNLDDAPQSSSFTDKIHECKFVDLVRFNGPLFFANASYLEDQINDRIQNKKDLKHLVLVSNGINDMDASGEETLSLIVDNLRSAGIDISLCGVNQSVMKVLERTHLIDKIGEDHIYPTMEKAVCSVHTFAHSEEEPPCPLVTACKLI